MRARRAGASSWGGRAQPWRDDAVGLVAASPPGAGHSSGGEEDRGRAGRLPPGMRRARSARRWGMTGSDAQETEARQTCAVPRCDWKAQSTRQQPCDLHRRRQNSRPGRTAVLRLCLDGKHRPKRPGAAAERGLRMISHLPLQEQPNTRKHHVAGSITLNSDVERGRCTRIHTALRKRPVRSPAGAAEIHLQRTPSSQPHGPAAHIITESRRAPARVSDDLSSHMRPL